MVIVMTIAGVSACPSLPRGEHAAVATRAPARAVETRWQGRMHKKKGKGGEREDEQERQRAPLKGNHSG